MKNQTLETVKTPDQFVSLALQKFHADYPNADPIIGTNYGLYWYSYDPLHPAFFVTLKLSYKRRVVYSFTGFKVDKVAAYYAR